MKKKLKEILYIYEPQEDGELDMCIKFGKVYTVDTPVGSTMPVKNFLRRRPGTLYAVHTSFTPAANSKESMEQALRACGFIEKYQQQCVRVNAIHHRPTIYFNIDLDDDLSFRYLSLHPTRFASIDVIAADPNHADLRVAVTSTQKFTDPSSTVGLAREYMRDDWVCREPRHGLVINKENPLHDKLEYASTRKESVYVLQNPRTLHSAFEKNVQVRIQEATHYDQPGADGRFRRVETRTEVFLHVTTKDAIAEVAESSDFIHSLLSFSFRLNPQ